MIRGEVIGEVWATRKSPGIRGRKLLLVAEHSTDESGSGSRPTGRVVVAADLLDAGEGDTVIVAFGSGARNAVKAGDRSILVDAAVVQIMESP